MIESLELVIASRPAAERTGRAVCVAAAAGVALLALLMLSTGDFTPILPFTMLAMVIGLISAVVYTSRHTEWLVFAVALLYLLNPVALVSEDARGFIHYGTLLLLVLPILPRLLRSGLLRHADFGLYCCYFAWALVTTLYSLAPMFSLARLLGSLLGFAAAAVSVLYVTTASEAHRLLYRFFLACSIMVGVTALGALALPHSITWQTPADGLDPSYVSGLRAQGVVIAGIDRFRGLFGNANDVGALMLAAVSSSLACWKFSSRRQRYVLTVVIVAATIAAVCADSRSALGALLVGCALYILWQYRVRGAFALGVTSILVVAALSLVHGIGAYASRDLDTLTGRTDIWAFTLQQIRERPFTGYGYEVSGGIFASRYFPLWYGPWDMGPRSSLHDGYLAHLVGVGVPATALWLFIVLRPWVFVFRQTSDPWNLKSVALLTVIPALVYNFTEAALPDFFGLNGFFFGLTWALAERYRLQAIERQRTAKEQAFESLPPAAQAFE